MADERDRIYAAPVAEEASPGEPAAMAADHLRLCRVHLVAWLVCGLLVAVTGAGLAFELWTPEATLGGNAYTDVRGVHAMGGVAVTLATCRSRCSTRRASTRRTWFCRSSAGEPARCLPSTCSVPASRSSSGRARVGSRRIRGKSAFDPGSLQDHAIMNEVKEGPHRSGPAEVWVGQLPEPQVDVQRPLPNANEARICVGGEARHDSDA